MWVNSTEIYDPVENKWSPGPNLCSERQNPTAANFLGMDLLRVCDVHEPTRCMVFASHVSPGNAQAFSGGMWSGKSSELRKVAEISNERKLRVGALCGFLGCGTPRGCPAPHS